MNILARYTRGFLAAGASLIVPAIASAAAKSSAQNNNSFSSLPGLIIIAIIAAVVISLVRRKTQDNARIVAEANRERDSRVAQQLAAISAGRLPDVDPVGIVKMQNERFFFAQEAQHGQIYKNVEYVTSNPALYVPLGHGFRGRIGGSRGRRVAHESFMWDAVGMVYMSNIRMCFKPHNRVDIANIPYAKIVSYDLYPDGIALMVDGVGVQQFRTGDQCLSELFKRVVNNNMPTASPA